MFTMHPASLFGYRPAKGQRWTQFANKQIKTRRNALAGASDLRALRAS